MKKLLIIDDEPYLIDVLHRIFDRLGYETDSALSGESALQLLKQNSYWAVFCDLKMPGMNGFDVFEEAKNMNHGQSRRFVLLTGAILDAAMENVAASERIILCRKPFHVENIKEILHSLEASA